MSHGRAQNVDLCSWGGKKRERVEERFRVSFSPGNWDHCISDSGLISCKVAAEAVRIFLRLGCNAGFHRKYQARLKSARHPIPPPLASFRALASLSSFGIRHSPLVLLIALYWQSFYFKLYRETKTCIPFSLCGRDGNTSGRDVLYIHFELRVTNTSTSFFFCFNFQVSSRNQ